MASRLSEASSESSPEKQTIILSLTFRLENTSFITAELPFSGKNAVMFSSIPIPAAKYAANAKVRNMEPQNIFLCL